VLVVGTIVVAGVIANRWRRRQQSPGASPSLISEIDSPLIERGHPSLEDIKDWIHKSPKIELHCHLNGSVRKSTLRELLPDNFTANEGIVHTIEDAFSVFKSVYQAVTTEDHLRRIVRECLEDALSDNVRYLELRTTPRKLADLSNRRDYVKVVIDEISKFPNIQNQRPLVSFPHGKLAVRLILTIDRAQPVSVADQTVDIALRFSDWVVGIDFAGNPKVGTFADFRTVFARAKGHGLHTTVHTSEIRDVEAETDAILDFKPNRIGHFLFPTEAQIKRVVDEGIAIESCPTSNICAFSGKSPIDGDMTNHSILDRFIGARTELVTVNTDDPGVFDVSLSDELFSVAKSFKLNLMEVKKLMLSPARHAFLTKQEKEALVLSLAMA
jgi:adenosine deaminase